MGTCTVEKNKLGKGIRKGWQEPEILSRVVREGLAEEVTVLE